MSDQTDDALLDDLTEEERAAMAYEEGGETDVNQEPAAEATAEPAPVVDEEEAPAPAADPEPAATSAEPAAAAEPEPEPATAVEQQAAPAPAPILIAQAPEDAQAKLDQIAVDKAALLDKYEAGEITTKELHTQVEALDEQKFEIKQQVREAELAQKMEAQRQQNDWDRDCRTFLDANAADYRGDDKAERVQALDAAIKVMAAMPVNRGIAGPALLSKAHAFVKASYGETVAPAPQAKPQKPVQPVVPKPDIPPTNVGKLPTADANDTAGGEFAVLDRLARSDDVEAYERAVEALSPAQRDRYNRR